MTLDPKDAAAHALDELAFHNARTVFRKWMLHGMADAMRDPTVRSEPEGERERIAYFQGLKEMGELIR